MIHTLVSQEPFRNHANMLIFCSRNLLLVLLSILRTVQLNFFFVESCYECVFFLGFLNRKFENSSIYLKQKYCMVLNKSLVSLTILAE